MLWTDKFAPKKFEEIKGNAKVLSELAAWLRHWKPGRAALLCGPPGTGKTLAVKLLAAELGAELIEMTGAEGRNKAEVAAKLTQATLQASLFSQKKIILVDEVDTVGRADRGAIGTVASLIKSSPYPVFLTANKAVAAASFDAPKLSKNPSKFEAFSALKASHKGLPDKAIWAMVYKNWNEIQKTGKLTIAPSWWEWNPKISSLASCCDLFRFEPLQPTEVKEVLEKMAKHEKIKCEDGVLDQLASVSGGDLRSAILGFQAVAAGKMELALKDTQVIGQRDLTRTIGEAIVLLLRSREPEVARQALTSLEVDERELMAWLSENAWRFLDKKDLSSAYEALGRADVFAGRIRRRQDWGLLAFGRDALIFGLAVAKTSPAKAGAATNPLAHYSAAATKHRRLRKLIDKKLFPVLHSSHATREYGFLLASLLKKNPLETLKLGEEEAEFLLEKANL